MYAEVKKISNNVVSLVSVRDLSQNTLNLEIVTKNKVVEMKMSLENIPIPYMIHLHKQTGDIIYIDLLKETLKVSRLQSSKSNIENQLGKEKVENKAHKRRIKSHKHICWIFIAKETKGLPHINY